MGVGRKSRMMKNSIRVQILFSYQGVSYSPSTIIDLDSYLEKSEPIPAYYHLVARDNAIDTYSYQYEVMEVAEVHFSDAQGLAQKFCQDKNFDMDGFKSDWQNNRVFEKLSIIAKNHFDVDDLNQNKKLKDALFEAYELSSKI